MKEIKTATSLPIDGVYIVFSQPNNFMLEFDYGDGITPPVITIPNPTVARCTITIENSDVQPDPKCEYYDGDSWINIDTTSGVFSQFLIDDGGSPHVWTYEITLSPTANLAIWGGKSFRVSLASDFVDGDKIPFVIYPSEFRFDTSFGTPPTPKFINQPENISLSPSGASFTTSFKAYNASVVGNWQYSDNYNEMSPGSATWTDVTEASVGMSEEAFGLVGDLMGYGDFDQLSYTVITSTLTVDLSAYVYGRRYRYKSVAK